MYLKNYALNRTYHNFLGISIPLTAEGPVGIVSARELFPYWSSLAGFPNTQFPGGGGTPLYKLYRYVPPHWVGFLRRFGLKTGIPFAHFGLESGMVLEGTKGVYERIFRFNSNWVRKKEKYAHSKWI